VAIWPGKTKGADKPGPAILLFAKASMNQRHRRVEVFRFARPSRRKYTWRTAQCGNTKAGIIGQRDQSGGAGRGERLDSCVPDKISRILDRLRKADISRRHDLDPKRQEQRPNFGRFASIMGRKNKPLTTRNAAGCRQL
jgi:hypothetical protein